MTGTLLLIAGALVGLVLGWAIGWTLRGRRPVPDPHAATLERLAEELASGRRPDPREGDTPEVRALAGALARGWAPRNEERARSLQEALGRIAAFLRDQVRAPLQEALGRGTPEALRGGAERAVGGLDDLEFFLREPLTADEVHNLVPLIQQVTREFATDWEVTVRLRLDDKPVRAHLHRDTFLDAVYLLLHNAGRFSKGETIDVSVLRDGNEAKVLIRDRGPGFSSEALQHAQDLFYTTTPSALGLGIPFARKIIESFGGRLLLRNAPAGGAEVELALPAA